MFVGALPPVSNKASWTHQSTVVDDETGEAVDISALTIVMEVVDPCDGTTVLSASTTDGNIVIVGTGVFEAKFTRNDMATLLAQTYQVGATLADTDDTVQIIIGTLPVLGGIVR